MGSVDEAGTLPYKVSDWQQELAQETKNSSNSLGEAAEHLADLWATRADILMNLGGLKRASTVPRLKTFFSLRLFHTFHFYIRTNS